mgnify:CR=1 FL=1
MRNIKAILKKELNYFFNSPMAYIFLITFCLINGYFFSKLFFLNNQSNLRVLFNNISLVYLFFIPAITMGLIAREKSTGTIEIISTLPIHDWEFIIGKYLSTLVLIFVALLFTCVHFFTLLYFGTNIDLGAIFCGYIGLFLVGAFYAAIGLFASSLTDNQVIGFIVAISIVIFFFLMGQLLILVPSYISPLIQYLSVDYHFSNISRGVIDTRNLIYFGSMITTFLLFSIRVLEMRRWK